MKKIFSGLATALYTPFTNNKIDYPVLSEMIDEQIDAGVDAIVLLGTTGESPTITEIERKQVIKYAVSAVRKRIPLIIGCGTNDTAKTVRHVKQAKDLGADCALCVTPYYNKPTQDGIIKHYEKISVCDFPILLYNVPSRTGVNTEVETIIEISKFENICGIKEASKDLIHIENLFEKLKGKLPIYCGNDDLIGLFLECGASGAISVTSNIIPYKFKEYITNFKNYYDIDFLEKINSFLSLETNPIIIKTMAEILGKKGTELRLPLTKATIGSYKIIKEFFKAEGLVK